MASCRAVCAADTQLAVCAADTQLAVMRAKDVAKEHEWGSRLEVRECAADLAADTDIPLVLTMLSNAEGACANSRTADTE